MTRPASFSWVLAVSGALFFLRFGYEFGAGDQEELYSLLLHRLDPTLFARDWYVIEQGAQFNVRTPFLWLMGALASTVPLELATLAVYGVAWVGVAWGVYRLAETFGAQALVAAVVTVAVLAVVPTWTLGGNALVADLLAPEMIAWALALPAVRLASDDRVLGAGLLLGLAAYLQFLVGVLTAGALGLAIVLGGLGGSPSERWRRSLILGGAALVVALPMVWGVAYYRAAGALPPDDGLSTFFLTAELRLPHHYLPLEFGRGRWARFGLLVVLGGAGLGLCRRAGRPLVFVERFLIAIGALCLVAGIAIQAGESLFVARLQVFKLTVVANALLVVAAGVGAATRLSSGVRLGAVSPRLSVAIPVLITIGLGAAVTSGALDGRIGPRARAPSPFTAVERWIRTHTARDALVAVPPANSTFRFNARRSVVATYKPAPFQDGAMHEWYARLKTLAPRADPDRARGLAFGDELDRAYAENTRPDWDRIVSRYGVTHIVRDRRRGGSPRGRAVFEAGPWEVYAVLTPRPAQSAPD